MKIMITGGSGRIGTTLINELKKNTEYEIISYDIKTDCDILNYERLRDVMIGVDVVVHTAAYPGPSTIPNLRKGFELNIKGTFNVAEACKERGVKKLIFTSSTGYYGVEKTLKRELPLDESDSPFYKKASENEDYRLRELAYSTTKACSEALLSIYGLKKMFQVIILRLAPIGLFMGLGLNLNKCAEAIILAIESEKPLWYECFNVVNVGNLSTTKIEKVLGFKR